MDASQGNLTRQAGQTLMLFSVALGGLLLCLMAVVDIGFFLHERQSAQKAADAGALAAAGVLANTGDASAAADAGYKWAESNGYDDLESIDVNIPPLSGEHSGDGRYAEVVIRTRSSVYFGGLIGESNLVHTRPCRGHFLRRVPGSRNAGARPLRVIRSTLTVTPLWN
jgi:hypothetical protein